MDTSTKLISNEQLDKHISESTYSMNSLGICLDYSFVIKSVTLNWYDILFAIENGYLSCQSAVEHASLQLEVTESYSQAVLDLACLKSDEANHLCVVQPYINELADKVSVHDKNVSKQKMLYVILKWVFENRGKYLDPLKLVEIIYADFDYPDAISSFVRYMPPSKPNMGMTKSKNEKLFDNWSNFLDMQRAIFAN